MQEILELIKQRHSSRIPFDPARKISLTDLKKILEAASWSPTAHNMQNFEIIVVDDVNTLETIGEIKSAISEVFIKENYAQLSFSEEELRQKKTGVLAAMFPPSWRDPKLFSKLDEVAFAEGPSFMKETIRHSPTLLFVTYDSRKRAPASEGDVLGFISLGCVMQNMWLMSESLGIGYQILSAFSSDKVEKQVKKILEIPEHMKIAFTVRLGYPKKESAESLKQYLRVRRDVADFSYHNQYGNKLE
jgi:nitroreductase